MTGDWPVALLVLLCGPVAGSFLGVVVDRWPAGRSLWTRSACNSCRAGLGWRDLVPILSGLGGTCRHCGAAIPGHLLRIELAALGASCLAVALADGPAQTLALALWLWSLVGLFYADLLHFRLPDPLTAALALAGVWLAATVPGRGLADGLISAAAGSGVFWALRWGYGRLRGREGLGLGDVKIMAGIGAGVGWPAIPLVALIAALLGLAAAVLPALRQGRMPGRHREVPFGTCLAGAAVLVLLL